MVECWLILLWSFLKISWTVWKLYSIERTQFCHRNCYLQSSNGHNSKNNIYPKWFLPSTRRLMLVNISMKFHEDILNGFQVTERTRFCHWNCYLQSSKGHNSKIYIQELLFLRSAHRLLLWRSMRIYWKVFKLQSGHDFMTDRQTGWQTTMAKTIVSWPWSGET